MGGVPVQELQLPLCVATETAAAAATSNGERQRGVCAAWRWAARRSLTAQIQRQRDALVRPGDGTRTGAGASASLPVTARAVAEALPCLGCAVPPEGAAMPALLWGTPRWPAGTLCLGDGVYGADTAPHWRDGDSAAGALVVELLANASRSGGAEACAAPVRFCFHDPTSNGAAVPTDSSGSGRPSPPDSLLLPDYVCVRRSQPRTAAALASGDDGDVTPPSVEVVFIAVEGLTELQPVRRRGLRLYTKLLALHLDARQGRRANLCDGDEAGDALGAAGTVGSDVPMPPPFAWRCELWTASPAMTEPGHGGAPVREVVQYGSYSPYACNKPRRHPHPSATASTAAHVPSSSQVAACAAVWAPVDLAAWTAELSTFADWWRALTAVSPAAATPPTPDAPLPEVPALSSAELAHTAEELMHWWAATRVRHSPVRRPPPPPLPPLPSSATPLFGAVVVPPPLRRATDDDESDASSAATSAAVPALTLCFVNPKGTVVHRYDHDAANVLCRAVHSLHAAVYVGDAAQKAALLAWLQHRVRQVDETAEVGAAAAQPACPTTEALSDEAGGTRLAYAYDAVAEVAQRCFSLSEYVQARHRDADTAAALRDSTTDVQSDLHDMPTLAWCRAAQCLSYDDVCGRRRLDLVTRPFQLRRPAASASRRAARTEAAPAAPTLALQCVPLSFLSFALTRLAEAGVEEVEPLTATVLQMGRRLSEH